MNTQIKKILMTISIVFLLTPAFATADSWFGKKGVAPVTNKLYIAECSACHYPYQPGLLPARSWKKMFTNLENHFGEDASMAADDTATLMQYAMENGADTSSHKRSVKINRSIKNNATPLRITETRYIIQKHDELSSRHIANNPNVKTLARCEACHTRIDTGSFSEREIKIPGIGRWED